jgi:hypothetical protein
MNLRLLLRRGALLAAANWPVIATQFVAATAVKILLTIPVIGGAFLVVVLVGGNAMQLLSAGIREGLSEVATVLMARPVALAAFLLAFLIALGGGSVFMFLIKGGTVTVLVAGDRGAGVIERGPWRVEGLRRASAFSPELFIRGCQHLFTRYVTLGLGLMVAYAISGGVYLALMFTSFQSASAGALFLGWTMMAAVWSSAFVVWVTIVNLIYLLAQVAIAVEDVGVRTAMRRVGQFLRQEPREVAGVFGVVLLMVVLTTTVSVLATTGLGLVAFVPIVGLAVFPLQALAWVVRGFVFEYVGLTALCAYLSLYRAFVESQRVGPHAVWPDDAGSIRSA